MRKVVVAKSAGFCFGVDRAVKMARKALEDGGKIYSLGQIIHNNAVVGQLCAKGLTVVDSIDRLPDGASVIIRSHGIGGLEHESLEKKRAEIIDATCPKVSHIHQIARRASEAGRTVIIMGAQEHPEIRAVCGWCEKSIVFPDAVGLEQWLRDGGGGQESGYTLVFQTTQTEKLVKQVEEILKKLCTNIEMFDTICGATSVRQQEARRLASECDAMVVIGDRHSANSVHLAEICAAECARVSFIETASELQMSDFDGADTIGITAGASAPAWIIKEVERNMSDEIFIEEPQVNAGESQAEAQEAAAQEAQAATEQTPEVQAEAAEGAVEAEQAPEVEKSFDELLEDSIKPIYNGDTVSVTIAAITPTEISVDFGAKYSGYIPIAEFSDDPEVKIEDSIKVGDTIDAYVVHVSDSEGMVMLSKKRLDAAKNWSDIEAARESGDIVEGIVTEENKGGIVVSVKGVRVFVPASQTGLGKDAPMSELKSQKVRLKITEVNRSRRRVVGSIRAVLHKERKEREEKVWGKIEEGMRFSGVVKSLTSYGAFVDIGGVDGMVHVSELSWNRIRQPSDMLSVGDNIEVYVIGFDRENRKISLGHKDPGDNPWLKFKNSYSVGDVANVRIVKLMPFGAFAEIVPGVDGLIHISQIANRRIGKPDEVLSVDDKVDAKITNIDEENQKISLSIRALSEPEPAPAREQRDEPDVSAESHEEDALVYEVSATGESSGLAPEADEE